MGIDKSYDFLFEGKNNEYDEEYKDYIEGKKKQQEEIEHLNTIPWREIRRES